MATIKHRGREIQAGEDTPLSVMGLAQFFHCSRSLIHADIRRGYKMEYGTTSTPRHFRRWLAANPRVRKARKGSGENEPSLERDLARLN